jgi:hypothetical protein
MIAAAGAGPTPIPHRGLDSNSLAKAIALCLSPEVMAAARNISSQMSSENGVQAAVQSFHANLPLESMQCDILRDLPAAWEHKRLPIKLSKVATQLLIDDAVICESDIKL